MSNQNQPWYQINALTTALSLAAVQVNAESVTEILIYGSIGSRWDEESVTASRLVRDLQNIKSDVIRVRINSVGGSVPDGIAIFNALKRHDATIEVYVDGMAASIASLIAMAGDTVTLADNALLMIHAPWTFAMGNSADLRETADVLDKFATAMATSYAEKSGKTEQECLALMTDGKDHWFTAKESVDEGFADATAPAVEDESTQAAAMLSIFSKEDLARFNPPAAAAAFYRKEATMPQNNPAANPQPATPTPQAIVTPQPVAPAPTPAFARTAEMNAQIAAQFKPFASRDGISDLERSILLDPSITVEAAGTMLLAKLGESAEPATPKGAMPHITTVVDEGDKFRAATTQALMARAGLDKHDDANQFRGHTLLEVARASCERNGIRVGNMGKMDIVAAAFTSTSDFPALLTNVAQKAMLKGYEEANETFQNWTSVGILPDFKEAKRLDLNTFPALDQVREGGEYKYANIGERGETIQLATYGKLFAITRQAIINDDLNAFSKIPRLMGRAAIRTVGNLVYAVLTGNPNMADGTALFHADHKNLLTGAGLSTAAVDALRVAMAKQTDGNASALNIRGTKLIVPVALEGQARQVNTAEYEVGASAKNNTVPNYVRGLFEVISDARIDAAIAAGSPLPYFLAADPMVNDTIEVAYLDGIQTPVLEQQDGWKIDGVEFKVRLDAGVKALDFRTMAKNPGA